MIPNSQPYVALVFQGDHGYLFPVAAWREDGTPMVCYKGQLCSVKTIPGFKRIIIRIITEDTMLSWPTNDPFKET